MPTRERRAERGRQRGLRTVADIGRAFRLARRSLGLSQAFVARLADISQALYSRIERGKADAGIVVLSAIGDILGLELTAKLWPAGAPVRDAGHVRLLNRLKLRMPSTFRWRTEIPIPIAGDLRSIDAMIVVPRLAVGFELESRLVDAQALVRRVVLKQRDADLACMIIVLPDTLANRQAAAGAEATLRGSFPLESRAILAALREGNVPAQNGILFV